MIRMRGDEYILDKRNAYEEANLNEAKGTVEVLCQVLFLSKCYEVCTW